MKHLNVALLVFLSSLFIGLPKALSVEVPKDPKEALELGRAEKQKGLVALNRARQGGAGEAKLAKKAMKHFEAAQLCYGHYLDNVEGDEKAEEEMADLQSLLYWCRKMTPLRDEDVDDEEPPAPDDDGKTAPPKPLPRSPLEGPPPGEPAPDYQPPKPRDPNEVAREWYEDAERFARQFPHLTLQIVAAYFRVADNFRDTEWGRKALEKSIQYAKGWKDKADTASPAPKTGPADPKPSTEPSVEDPTLLRLRLRSQDPKARVQALKSLVHSIGGEAVSDLHEMFLGETEPSVRKEVLAQLIRLKDKRTRKAFKTFWNVRDREIAEDFIRLVCAIGSEKEVKYAVYTTVVNVDRLMPPGKPAIIDTNGDALDAYIANVESAYSGGLRAVLAGSLRKMGKKGTKGLTNLFKSRGLATREAILTMGMVGDVKAGGKYVVIYLAQYKAGVYLGEALASLKLMGDDAIPFLIQTLGKPKLKQWAGWLLRNISGKPYSSGNPAKWWAWYREYKRGR